MKRADRLYAPMSNVTDQLAGSLVSVEPDLEREFEARLVESSTLAFRVAFGVLRHRQDAEDVAQEAFAKAYRSFRELRDRNRFRAWLVRMTWRLAIDRQRADRRRASRDVLASSVASGVASGFSRKETESGEPTAEEILTSRERTEKLWEAIDALPEKLRVVVVLAGIQEHDLREVAALLGLPTGTIKSRLFLARQRLRERLQWDTEEQTR